MSRLKLVNAKKMENLLCRLGFEKVRQKGSYAFYKHPDGRVTTIPHHKARVLARPLIREILRETEITVDDYNDRLKKL
ncbi:MAG TPA: type II toxin-antitoxin system HicA family toxin [Sedimentisphaerales bacterium]|nr:type II toxin-antitoxin system HicA family toxin [Sedimentisphaerales bacterium]